MNKIHDIPGPHQDIVAVPAIGTSDATGYVASWVAPFQCRVTLIEFLATVAVTGANTHTRHLNVDRKLGSGAGTVTEIANLDLVLATDLVVGNNAIPIGASVGYVDLLEGDYLLLEGEEIGTGIGTPIGSLVITYQGN